MGVAGAGKSTVAAAVAARLGWPFIEGDAFHAAANIEKMRLGIPLDDTDREPWLREIARALAAWRDAGSPGVITCSALRRAYRAVIRDGHDDVCFVYLRGSRAEIAPRLATRTGHFMPATLLDSQFAALEEPAPPERFVAVNVTLPGAQLVDTVLDALGWNHAGAIDRPAGHGHLQGSRTEVMMSQAQDKDHPEHKALDDGSADSFPASDVPKTVEQAGVVADDAPINAAPAVSAIVRRMLVTGLGALHQSQLRMNDLLIALQDGSGALGEFTGMRAEASLSQTNRINSVLTHFGHAKPETHAGHHAPEGSIAALYRQSAEGPVRDLAGAYALHTAIQQEVGAFQGLEILARKVDAPHTIEILKECQAEASSTADELRVLIEHRLLPEASASLNAELPKELIEKAFGGA